MQEDLPIDGIKQIYLTFKNMETFIEVLQADPTSKTEETWNEFKGIG